ncbi:MAG: alcohol dehydrogenase catalytic domain-containing protein [Acidobacteriota bacterium]|nr:alcohol dehydrogenase catalytic domain-containing protein [Acidobacteriota bacterium]
MKAAVLEDVEKMTVRPVPDPEVRSNEVLIRVKAVGVCGTDLHLFRGQGNYNLDQSGRPVPLREQPQILGHEFAGEILETGGTVNDLKPGDEVLCDQGRNCHSHGREELCEYCASGDSHQCRFYQEHGITGLPGALAEYIAIPAVNCVRLSGKMTASEGALVEPLGCVLHACDRMTRAEGRYKLGAGPRVRNIMISGAGPAGLLFLQVLRQVYGFDGLILISDLREKNLDLARQFGGTALNASRENVVEAAKEMTRGEGIQYLIESCGNPVIFDQIPGLLRKQGTVLLYGHGHKGRDIGVMGNVLFLEPALVASVGASGGFDEGGRPSIYRRARDLMSEGRVQAMPFVTHRYTALENVHSAFEQDFGREDYIKGLLTLN